MNKILFFLLCVQSVFSQTILKGKVVTDGNPDGILIVNYTTKVTAITENAGFFSIEAKVNDKLVITSDRIEGIEIKLNANSFQQNPLEILVNVKSRELDEIVVNNITTKSLGIIPKNVKEYTPAERRLRTSGTGGPVGLVANLITGQKKMLKKAVEFEKYEMDAEKLLLLFGHDFFEFALRIQNESLDGFLVYASENKEIARLLHQKNITSLKLQLVEIAFKFKEMKNE